MSEKEVKLKELLKEDLDTIKNFNSVEDVDIIEDDVLGEVVLIDTACGNVGEYYILVNDIIPKYDDDYVVFCVKLHGGE